LLKFSALSVTNKILPQLSVFGFTLNPFKIKAILFVLSVVLYANTLGHEYTQDDAIVIYDNMYVEQGIKGIPGLLSKDTFFGFFKVEGKQNLVSGGRYRPLTPIMFAIEWEIQRLFKGDEADIKTIKPVLGHLINVLLYALLTVLIFSTLFRLLYHSEYQEQALSISFIAALIFAAHPIHTEAVANVYAFYLILKSVDLKSNKHLLASGVIFFLGLMSKENTITYLAVIPLALYLFRSFSITSSLKKILPLIGGTIGFLIIRTIVLGKSFGAEPLELMNNPYLKIVNNSYVPFDLGERYATIMFTLGKYVNLLFYPHPLTHDYYPRHVEVMNFGNATVLLSVVMYLTMIIGAFMFLKKNKIASFSILYFIITLSIVSNIVFPIGTNMSERFMFMPSIGFALFIAAMISKLKNQKLAFGLVLVILFALSAKTITRNNVWHDNFTLFTTDIKTSKRSAKLLNAAGGALTTEAGKLPDGPKKTQMLNEAVGYLNEAVKIHPNYKNAYLLLGNAHNFLKNYEQSITSYDRCLSVAPGYETARENLGITLREAGRYSGEQKNDMVNARKYLLRAYEINNKDYVTVRLLGVVHGMTGDQPNAIRYFSEALAILPTGNLNANQKKQKAQAYVELGTAYKVSQDETNAQLNFQKAVQLDPSALNKKQ